MCHYESEKSLQKGAQISTWKYTVRQKRLAAGLHPDLRRELTALPEAPYSWTKGVMVGTSEGKGKETWEKGTEGEEGRDMEEGRAGKVRRRGGKGREISPHGHL